MMKQLVRFFSSPRNAYLFGLVIALVATSMEVFKGKNTNYFDYQDSTRMLWEGITPYTLEFVHAHRIYFLYIPVFNVLFAPIFFLPWWLGPYVWNITHYTLVFTAIRTLPKKYDPYKQKIFLFLLPILLQAVFCYQFNMFVCYVFLFAYSLLERGKGFWAVLLIMMSACTKIYGGVELALLFCYPKTWRNFGYAILCGTGLLMLPALLPGVNNPLDLYQQMVDIQSHHHSAFDWYGMLFVPGLKPFLLPNYRTVQIIILAVLAVGFFACYKKWGDFRFRASALAILMGYIILWSDCPEVHTYLIALAGYNLYFWLQKEHRWYDWAAYWFLFVNFCILPIDVIFPAKWHIFYHYTFGLDVYVMALCWMRIVWEAISMKLPKAASQMAVGLILYMMPMAASAQKVEKAGGQKTMKAGEQKVFEANGVKFVMTKVDGGTFTMGNAKARGLMFEDEKPAHAETVGTFLIGQTEVTQELWEAVMGKNRSKIKGKDHPVDYITWDDCHKFIDKLNAITHQKFRLPTEAEWEYAARGGSKSKGYRYAGSNNYNAVAYTLKNGETTHHPVASLRPNELGLYDMSGNVWEWCEDFYGKYDSTKRSSYFHVIRGGSFNSSPAECTVTNRYPYDTRRRQLLLGMRLAL